MTLSIVHSHYRENRDPPADIAKECQAIEKSSNARTVIPLTNAGLIQLSEQFPLAASEVGLDTLPDKLRKDNEIGFSPIFDPKLVEACCVRGIFPLALSLGRNFYVFAPKLHTARALVVLVESPTELRAIKHFPFSDGLDGAFNSQRIHPSKKLIRPYDTQTRRAAFDVFVNRHEDWVDALTLIRAQHGENWLCKALRDCFYWIFLHPQDFRMKVILTVIRRHIYNGVSVTRKGEANEGDVVAAELGYIVGDIYTSATGAYCVDGAGTLQLYAIAQIIKRIGCVVWDLGMQLDYKQTVLGCVEVRRKQWLEMVRERRDNSCLTADGSKELLRDLQNGIPVSQIMDVKGKTSSDSLFVAKPESKSQIKKRQKLAALEKRKHKVEQDNEESAPRTR